MKNFEVYRQIQRLEALMKLAKSELESSPELLGHWARYFCVLTSGLLENAIAELYGKYVEGCAAPAVVNFAASKLRGVQNPNAEKFVQIAGSFSPQWASELAEYMADGGRKDAIDSIMATRHHVAHGKDTGITIVRIQDYLKRSIEVLEFIETQLGL